eukprot:TRINITY_DN4245_c0_g1_i1.p1 TRINITY_DN4245_c0_g1~~TRINITY_DN4245_c0_g1_i1.p1  ORF type:complete len:107 (-),score=22.91 TRINITY_DN4245_c0_g1_i1:66-338(-)
MVYSPSPDVCTRRCGGLGDILAGTLGQYAHSLSRADRIFDEGLLEEDIYRPLEYPFMVTENTNGPESPHRVHQMPGVMAHAAAVACKSMC